MNKIFSNIIIFDDNDINNLKEKIEKIIIDLENEKCTEKESKFKVELFHDPINNISMVNSAFFEFKDSSTNKSVIRKISKRFASDTFMVSSKEDYAVCEKYSFNKRIYDYMTFGNDEKLESLGYDESYERFMYPEIWKNHFVGRNTINDVVKLLDESKTFFDPYEIICEILKLYGIKYEFVVYNTESNSILNHEIQKDEIYFK